MKTLTLAILATIFFGACSTTNQAVAMNEYNPKIANTNDAAVAVITPEMIKEVQERRMRYIREHGDLDL